MSSFVLDTSALVAILRNEKGADQVKDRLHGALVSSVTLSEVLCKTIDKGGSLEMARAMLSSLPLETVPFDDEQAAIAASIHESTLGRVIAFADRACLALALSRQLPILTSDRQWKKLKLNLQVECFR
ncbi:MAG: type II toxin-antitoxin system VapC family toxin [Pirellulaceae bacterium]|nr:type II toxin-antitoxin system VapC family toxin [Planctomycetales bacterium]